MNRQEEHADARAQQPIDFPSIISSLETARVNLSTLSDKYEDQVSKLEEAYAKRSQEVLELNAARDAQVQDSNAASAAQSFANKELCIAHEKLTEAHLAQSAQLAALTAEVAQLKDANQSATKRVASLESAAVSQLQAYKDLKNAHDVAVAFQEEQSKVLIRVNAVKNAQAEELAKLNAAAAAPQVKVKEQAKVDNFKRRASVFEQMYEDERKKVAELSITNLEQAQRVVDRSRALEALSLRFAGLDKANQELLHKLECAKSELSRKQREQNELRSSNGAHIHRVVELEHALRNKDAAYAQLTNAHYQQGSGFADLNTRFSTQSQELNYLRSQQQAWTQEASAYKAASSHDAARFNDLSLRYDQLNTAFINLDAQNKALQADHRKLNTTFSKLQTNQVQLNERHKKLQVDMRGVQETTACQTRLAKRLGEENAKLRSDIDKLQRETAQTVQLSAKKRKMDETEWKS